jgi:hypothetical protein
MVRTRLRLYFISIFNMIEHSKIAEQFRAHADRCRQLASRCPSEIIAAEMYRIADECIRSATEIETEAIHLEMAPGARRVIGDPIRAE